MPYALLGAVGSIPVKSLPSSIVKQIGVPVGVEVQQQTARLQHPRPFGVGLFRARKIPSEIAADHNVKAPVRKAQSLCVHLHPLDLAGQGAGVLFCLFEHGGREIDRSHVMAQLTEKDSKEARPGADLQYAQLLRCSVRKLLCDLILETGAPLLPLLGSKLQLVDLRIAGGATGPVAFVFSFNR